MRSIANLGSLCQRPKAKEHFEEVFYLP